MKTTYERRLLITPSGLQPPEYVSLFDKPSPPGLEMITTLFEIPGAVGAADEVRELIECSICEIALECRGAFPHLLIPEWPSQHAVDILEFPEAFWNTLSPKVQAWAIRGVFVQQSYLASWEAMFGSDLLSISSTSVSMFDQFVAVHGTVEPRHHQPLSFPGLNVQCWESLAGDAYRSGQVLWRRDLLDLHVLHQIYCRALLQGDDPMKELRRFYERGGKYHLEYLGMTK